MTMQCIYLVYYLHIYSIQVPQQPVNGCLCSLCYQLLCSTVGQVPTAAQVTIMPNGFLITMTVPATPVISNDTVENANSIFTTYKDSTVPVTLLSSYNRMLIQLSQGFIADWKMLGRSLGIGDASVYAIGRDHAYSINEQAFQMFHQWITMNGSGATLGTLTTAIYEAGPPYWNLLEVMYKYLALT